MFRKTLLLLGCLPVFAAPAYAQLDTATADSLMRHYVLRYDPSGITWFQPQTLRPGEALTMYHDYFYEDKWNTAQLIDQWTDPVLGMTHYKYQQYFDVLPVEGAQFIEHVKDGYVKFINGKVSQLKKEHAPQDGIISEQQAWAFLVQAKFSGDYRFAWEDPDWEQQIRTDMEDSNATFFPVPGAELLMALEDWKDLHYAIPPEKYRAAWKFEVRCLEPSFHKAYYVDAVTGEVFREAELRHTNGPASIWYHGTQTIDTEYRGFPHYDWILEALGDGRDFETKYFDETTPWGDMPHIQDGNDNWGTDDHGATAIHWFATQSWRYFRDIHNRNGMNGQGAPIRIHADGLLFDNAGFDIDGGRRYLYFGKINGGYFGRAIDVVGHEFTHGVTHATAGLEYRCESGALNESFSDIFGYLIERFAEGANADWVHSNDEPGLPTRSFADPQSSGEHANADCSAWSTGQPDTYEGNFWVECDTTCDKGGVHINSGVQNHWFYLISEGGSGTNDNGDSYNISPINIDDAADIAYATLTSGLIESSQYVDARATSIAWAIEFFGECSDEHIQVENAWYAVGVGQPNTCNVLEATERGSETLKEPFVYPNPASSVIFIRLRVEEPTTIVIHDLKGSKVLEKQVNDSEFSIDISKLKPGMYILSLQGKLGKFQEQIVKMP